MHHAGLSDCRTNLIERRRQGLGNDQRGDSMSWLRKRKLIAEDPSAKRAGNE
jgi:hypothetical protein